MTTGFNTDRYELTMLDAALKDGTADRQTVFELYARRLRGGRRYGVVAGTGRFLEALRDFKFTQPMLGWLLSEQIVDIDTARWLSEYKFTGNIEGYAEGELYFPGSPILTVRGTFAECVVLETLALSIFNFDSAIATAASRMVTAANGRPIIEMGSRRANEDAAVAAARAAYIAGFTSTSNLEAGFKYGIPTAGTSAHAFVLLHDDETAAFESQVKTLGSGTTLLVDTFDVARAVDTAVKVAGHELGAVRLDSGNFVTLVPEVRKQLDYHGAFETKIVVTGDMDENSIAALSGVHVDSFGVGTQLVTGGGYPTAEFIYKLVEVDGRPVAKVSADGRKSTRGGRKFAYRYKVRFPDRAAEHIFLRDVLAPESSMGAYYNGRPLQKRLVVDGVYTDPLTLLETRSFHERVKGELAPLARALRAGDPAIPTIYHEALKEE